MLVRMWSNRNSHSLLMGMQKWYSHFGRHLSVSYKIKHILTIQSSNAFLGIYPNELKTYVYIKTYTLIFVDLF